MVWKTAYRLLNHDADAADCFQRTFVAAIEFARNQPVRNWPALLRRLATARALEQLRERIRHRGRYAALADEAPADRRIADPLVAAQTAELARRMRASLVEIDPRQAHVFCLAVLEGLSYDEIAAELGLTVNHVGVLLNRARTSLQQRLKSFAPAEKESQREVQP